MTNLILKSQNRVNFCRVNHLEGIPVTESGIECDLNKDGNVSSVDVSKSVSTV